MPRLHHDLGVRDACGSMAEAAVSQCINSLPQVINQPFSADSEAAIVSPRHLNHLGLRTQTPGATVIVGRVKGHRDLEGCRTIFCHYDCIGVP